MDPIVTEALCACRRLQSAASDLEQAKANAAKMKLAASKTAEAKFQALTQDVFASLPSQSDPKAVLAKRKEILESWVAKQHETTFSMVDGAVTKRDEARDLFEAVVKDLVMLTFDSYCKQETVPVPPTLGNDDEFLKELQEEFDRTCEESVGEVPKNTQDNDASAPADPGPEVQPNGDLVQLCYAYTFSQYT